MKQIILARRYAKALFAVGKDDGKFEEYNDALQGLNEVYALDASLADSLTNPLYPMDVREKVMKGIVASMGVDKVMSNFFNLLVEKKRADVLPDIAEEYQVMVDEEKNISHGSVVSAVKLSKELQAKVQATLEKLTGKTVELTTSVDPTIIGGIIAKVGDLELDGSIRTQLASLKDSIKGRE
ncbi:F0F1 ATP synthase subunit delta [Desulfotalea psychrophila]|uniref:ATP synthase subunit delta n=1 Tax=Desulfotalea psychrophila TaxID=84980 RepID=A0ABS3AVM7_9BACT|nr:F0F1 ATP synthase subunit delta [Desulfocapsa sp.]MBN4068712.1 F0F1 ATP synthase subunit delta [Desulfotalea psychrophila]MBN4071563.1 F0F1 ATP synthase subunit delta [Desulfotalea psychrophila]